MSDINKTLEERASNYGDYGSQSKIAQALKSVMRSCDGWNKLSDDQKETLDFISSKTARILNGDPNYPDNFHDISGYATLSEIEIKKRSA